LVDWADEEGARFGRSLLGSSAAGGTLESDLERDRLDKDGIRLEDALRSCGVELDRAGEARRELDDAAAYLELHIEQGPVLDRRRAQIGVVEGITGLFKWEVHMIGAANHAGTTPMDMRQDALTGLVEFAAAIPRLLDEHGSPHSRATIGRVALQPGAANTVPGRATWSLDVRDPDPAVLDELGQAMRATLSAIARRCGLTFELEVLSEVAPVACDTALIELIDRHAAELGLERLRLPSGAVHDAQIMARVTRVGMIFVPSLQGRSHSLAEWTDWADIEAGANLTLQVLAELSGAHPRRSSAPQSSQPQSSQP
jgi:beta-ureidopropionase / N-carbamoyl-L-amino-acid hydrolase